MSKTANCGSISKIVVASLAYVLAATSLQAAPVGQLTTFSAGTPARAADVNGNFSTIVTTVNANDARLTTVETNKQNVVTGSCPAGSAIRAVAADGTVTCQNAGGNVGFASVNAIVAVPIPFFAPTPTITGCLLCTASGAFATSGSANGFIAAPIVLPQGATITSFSSSCVCNDAAGSSAFLVRDDVNILASTSITGVTTTVQTATTTTISTTPAGAPVVDNQNFAYFVIWSVNGTAGSAIQPVRATVTYTMP